MLARISLLTLLLTMSCHVSAHAAKDAEVETHRDEFSQMMAEVGIAFKNQHWQDPAWTPAIVKWLDTLESSVQIQTKRTFYKLPVKFADVTPNPGQNVVAFGAKKQLIVADTVNLTRAEDCIILATQSARVSFAKRCLIVAKGAIEVSHGEQNTLIAGHFAHVSHDGSNVPRVRPGQAAPALQACSLVMSGAIADISHAAGTIVSARKRVSISHARQVCFLNARGKTVSHATDCEDVEAVGLPFSFRAEMLTLPEIVQIVQVQPQANAFAVVKQGDFEYIWRTGKPLVDRHGEAIDAFAGWHIKYAHRNYLLFNNGSRFSSYLLETPGR